MPKLAKNIHPKIVLLMAAWVLLPMTPATAREFAEAHHGADHRLDHEGDRMGGTHEASETEHVGGEQRHPAEAAEGHGRREALASMSERHGTEARDARHADAGHHGRD